MPLTRYQIRNEYSLADPELYKAADRDDPEALLEGVAMAGLVGVLRQLGDLAEFAAEIFHDLHEEVMATSARGHGLMVRVQQLEAEFPSIERAFLSQTNHSSFFSDTGVDWHPNLRMEQNLITCGDLPRCVMDSYEECRGPPRLFLLDKFDVAGAGACLKRYTDPSFFKVDAAVEVQREKKIRKVKKKGSRWRNGETPEIIPTSHAKLHQLFLEESIEKGHTDPARLVKLKKRQLNTSPLDCTPGKSYMEKFLETSPEHNVVREISVSPLALKQMSDNSSESGLEILDISTVSPVKKSSQSKEIICSSPNSHELVLKPSMQELYGEDIDRKIVKIPEPSADGETDEIPSVLHKVMVEKEIAVNGEEKMEGSLDGDNFDDMTSEVDNYMDALTTMESEMETDNEHKFKTDYLSNVEKHQMVSDRNEEKLEFQAHFSDSQSVGNFSASDDGNSSLKRGRSSFSYSDTLSNVAENTLSDGEGSGKVFCSSEAFVAETTKTPSNQLLAYVEVLEMKSHDLALPNEMSTDEDNIHVHVEASSSSCHMDSNPTLLPLDCAVSPLPQKLDDESLKPASESSYVEETETNLIDSLAVVSDAPSQTSDDPIFTLCSESHPVDNVDGGESSVTSNPLVHLSNNSELTSEKRSGDDSIDEVLQTDFADESCPEKLTSKEEEVPCLALPQAEACSDVSSLPDSSNVVKPDDLLSEVDGAVLETGIYTEASTSMFDTSRTSFKGQQKPDSTEKAATTSEEANLEDISRAAESNKVGVSTCKVHAVEGDDVPPEISSDSIDCSILEDHNGSDDVAAESVQAENMVFSTAALNNVAATTSADDNVDNAVCLPQDLVCSTSSNLVNLPECPFDTGEPNQEGFEFDEPVSSEECLRVSETEDGTKLLEVASKDHESASSELVSYDSYKSKIDDVQDLSLANSTENSLSVDDAIIALACSALPDQELEPECLHQNHVLGDGEEIMSSPGGNLPDLEICSEQSPKLQADQLNVELVKAEGASSNSSRHQSEQIQSSEHVDQEKVSNDASEPCQGDLRSQSSRFENVGQSTGQEFNIAKQTMDILGSFLPSFGMLHEANQVNLEEMPPLPPLPPMQWRLGKNHHAQPFSQREPIDCRQLSFPSILPVRDDEKTQSGFSDQQGGIVQPGNPFLPLASTGVEKLHVSEQEVVKTVQPTPSSLQMPTVINDASNKQNGLVLEGTQSLNPFLTLSTLPNANPEHGLLASEDGAVQSSLNPFLSVPSVEYMSSKRETVSSQGNIIHPQNQLVPETALEGKAREHTSQNLEGDHGHPSDVSMLPSREVEEQPQHSSLTSDGETPWSFNPFALPTSEVGNANGSSLTKLPRPRNPLIDAVAALDKSKLRKVSERVRPQNGPNVDERDSLLEQIRTKSFNLKPAVVSRPSIHGPKTNLKVAAILEKANAIRQATAGSDEDDDEDSWSDS